jgi:GxxExxY protein
MPIKSSVSTHRISQEEFAPLAYEVMNHVFAIHNEFGRLFDENIYKRELANRQRGVRLEAAVDVVYQSFAKRYYADALVMDSSLFEFKAAEAIHDRHVAQSLNYLLLFNLAHGKIINVRADRVESRFINCHQQLAELRAPEIVDAELDASVAGAEQFRETLLSLVGDWGAGLELALYREALIHFFGGETQVCRDIPVFGSNGLLGAQRVCFIAPAVAFDISAVPTAECSFAIHAQRMIHHTNLQAIHWANITAQQITFKTIHKACS